MEQSSIDENIVIRNNETIETCMNDEIMEENVSVRTKTSKGLENEKKQQMKINLQNLHAQKKSWKPHGRLSLCWSFIVSMTMQNLTLRIHKSCIVSFVIKNM
jgi:hypothetical protein